MAENEQQSLNYIEETVLKKRKNSEAWAIRRRQQLQERKWKIKEDKKLSFKRAEQYIKDHRSKELDLIRMKSRVKRRRTDSLISESKLLFVIRIQGKNEIHPRTRKTLHLLGLRKIFTGVFLKANERTLSMLQRVEPYITYGNPNLKNVKELIHKKGRAKINDEIAPLTDNSIIEQVLGKYNIISIEDIVHEIAEVGPHFKEVVHFLWPLKLSKPERGLQGLTNSRRFWEMPCLARSPQFWPKTPVLLRVAFLLFSDPKASSEFYTDTQEDTNPDVPGWSRCPLIRRSTLCN